MPQPAIDAADQDYVSPATIEEDNPQTPLLDAPDVVNVPPDKKKILSRIIAVILVISFAVGLYLVWQPTTTTSEPDTTSTNINLDVTPLSTKSSATATSQQQTTSASTSGTTTNTNTIKLYIVGAIQHPGIYTLASDARVYQLLQAAGGPKPDANLVALNLAAHLNDGQEIYVPQVGENPPALTATTSATSTATNINNANNSTTQVNINTASADELRQQLHTTSKIAQEIVDYRLQHGPFASVDILQQVVSKSEYAKLKDMVTV